MSHRHKTHLLEVLDVFCPYPPMLGPTPGHVTCHRESSLEMDLLPQPRRNGQSGENMRLTRETGHDTTDKPCIYFHCKTPQLHIVRPSSITNYCQQCMFI